MTDRDVNEWLADPNTTSCQVYGHQFEDDENTPGRRVCTAPDCDESYMND